MGYFVESLTQMNLNSFNKTSVALSLNSETLGTKRCLRRALSHSLESVFGYQLKLI